ncbi:MAG: DUF3881 family protein [Lachnospiraceae bacterium]|nr:DUF3881 family protein [Lachnospiraceae bacterium]
MHDYLRALGFSGIRNKKEYAVLQNTVIHLPTSESVAEGAGSFAFAERRRDFLPNAGLAIRGEIDEDGSFTRDYDFPYFNGSVRSFTADVDLEKNAEREEYSGISEIPELGVSVIFHLNRLSDYMNSLTGSRTISKASVNLSALSTKGKVILPVMEDAGDRVERSMETREHNRIINAARNGDPSAYEFLALEDLDKYTAISQRLRNEDILSIVESSFMPYGIETDLYSVIGRIISCREEVNSFSGEKVCLMGVDINGIPVDLCINRKDLEGEPAPGRRFKGSIWLQGTLDF